MPTTETEVQDSQSQVDENTSKSIQEEEEGAIKQSTAIIATTSENEQETETKQETTPEIEEQQQEQQEEEQDQKVISAEPILEPEQPILEDASEALETCSASCADAVDQEQLGGNSPKRSRSDSSDDDQSSGFDDKEADKSCAVVAELDASPEKKPRSD